MPEESPSGAARDLRDPDANKTDRDVEPATMRAAVEQLRSVISRDGGTLQRLRAGLADLALALTRAKPQSQAAPIEPEGGGLGKPVDAAATIGELEARVAGLIALIDGPGANQAVADEAATVPTVSRVVSRLGRDGEPGTAPAAATSAPSVSALGAMVEALAAAMQPAPPSRELQQPVQEPAEREPLRGPTLPEVDLLSNFAKMAAVPYLPPEHGAAVIFGPQSEWPNAPATTDSADTRGLLPEALPLPPLTPASGDAPRLRTEEQAPRTAHRELPAPTHDPLAPLKSLSEAETIALFS
jgi:hypothetical protein